MAQIFHRSFNTISRVSIFGAVFIVAGLGWAAAVFYRSSYVTDYHQAYVQPVPFSHEHHVGKLGMDCRYCHGSVEESSFAGLPATKTCMNCHQEIWFGSETLEPVRASFKSGESIEWERTHRLPGFVYFDHSIHVQKGVGCVTCHGRVDQMPLTYQENSLLMEWCLECHRKPERFVRPKDKVFDLTWTPAKEHTDQATLGAKLVEENNVRPESVLTSCSTCHR